MRNAIKQELARRGEATAKQVADALGLEVKDVTIELNHMKADAEVEREKKKGNEYTWWLAQPLPALQTSAELPVETISTDQEETQGVPKAAAAESIEQVSADTQATLPALANPKIAELTARVEWLESALETVHDEKISLKNQLHAAELQLNHFHGVFGSATESPRYIVACSPEIYSDHDQAVEAAKWLLNEDAESVMIAVPIARGQKQVTWHTPS